MEKYTLEGLLFWKGMNLPMVCLDFWWVFQKLPVQ